MEFPKVNYVDNFYRNTYSSNLVSSKYKLNKFFVDRQKETDLTVGAFSTNFVLNIKGF